MGSFAQTYNYYTDVEQHDFFWNDTQDWHVYEKRERAIGPKPGNALSGLSEDSAEFRIRIAKAKALDKARKQLLTAIHEKEVEVYHSSTPPSSLSRTVDGQEKKNSEIML